MENIKKWFEWTFENPEKITPTHTALYFFCIYVQKSFGNKEKFTLNSSVAMESLGIASYNTYNKALNDLIKWKFIKEITRAKNQYQNSCFALSFFDKAQYKALDEALLQTGKEQVVTSVKIVKEKKSEIPTFDEFFTFISLIDEYKSKAEGLKYSIQAKYDSWLDNGWKDGNNKPIIQWKTKIRNTLPYLKPINNGFKGNTVEEKHSSDEQRRIEYLKRVFDADSEQPTENGNGGFEEVSYVDV